MELELYAMSCGWLTMPAMLAGEDGRIRIPVPTWLIRHPKGTVLFDSGLNRVTQQNSADYLGAAHGVIEIHFEPGEEISARLETIGFDPARIDILVNSHLHFDHAGGNALIPNARLLVQKREWEAAHEPDFTHSFVYNPDQYDLGHHGNCSMARMICLMMVRCCACRPMATPPAINRSGCAVAGGI